MADERDTTAPLPDTAPAPPPEAGRWAADRLDADGWQTMTSPNSRRGGGPIRWHDRPCDVFSRFGAGVYRVHWQTSGKRPLGTSEAFKLDAQPPPVAVAPPAAPQPPPPAPEPTPPAERPPVKLPPAPDPLPQIAAALAAVTSKDNGRGQLSAGARDSLAFEERAHERSREVWAHHDRLTAFAFEAAKEYRHELGAEAERNRQWLGEATTELRRASTELVEHTTAALDELRTAQQQQTERIEQIEQETDEAEPMPPPETTEQKIGAVLRAVATPEGQQAIQTVGPAVAKLWASITGQPEPALPSPAVPPGGSLAE